MINSIKRLTIFGIILANIYSASAQSSLQWAVASEGAGYSWVHITRMRTDSIGNILTSGYFTGDITLDPVNQTGQLSNDGSNGAAIFFCKRDSLGNLLSLFTPDGVGDKMATDFELDAEENIWRGGYFDGSIDMDPSAEEYLLTSMGREDFFLAKYSPVDSLLWAGQFGGTLSAYGGQIAIDSLGFIYFGGDFSGSIDLDPGPEVYEIHATGSDGFVCKLDQEGNFINAWQFEAPGFVGIDAMEIDAEGNLWCGGSFNQSVDFDPGEGVFILESTGYSNNYLVKLNPEGNFITAVRFGGEADMFVKKFVFNSEGSVLVTGNFNYRADFDPGPDEYILNTNGFVDCYILNLNKDGDFNWALNIGGEELDTGLDIIVDKADNIYVTGHFYLTADLNPGADSCMMQSAGESDGFLLKLDSTGRFQWASHLSSTLNISGANLILLKDGSILESGYFCNTADFDPGEASFLLPVSGDTEMFIRKLKPDFNVNIANIEKSVSANIFPNPNNGLVNIEVNEPSLCRIFDASGGLVSYSHLNNGGNYLNLSQLKRGFYAVQIILSNHTLTKKMMIQ